MKKKVGTVFSEDLLWEAKRVAVQRKKSLSALLEEALSSYLKKLEREKRRKGVVQKTKGIIRMSLQDLRAVMEEEIYEEI